MVKQFAELAERTKAAWPEEARAVYDAASAQFGAEMAAQVELGRQLTTAREQQRLSQQGLQVRTGIDQAQISRIERGAGNPTAATLLRLAESLGMKLTLLPVDDPVILSPAVGTDTEEPALPPEQDAVQRRRNEFAQIRQWANANGYTVSSRGRIASAVIEAYQRQNTHG